MKKMHFILSIIIILIVIWAVLFNEDSDQRTTTFYANQGLLDLEDWSFDKNGSIKLAGDWLYYPNHFYTYDDLQSSLVKAQNFEVPHVVRENPFGSHSHYGTLVLKVLLPESYDTLGLRSNLIFSSYNLYIDDQYQLSVGQVATTKKDYKPYVNVSNAFFHTDSKEITLIYHVADFDFLYNAVKPPVLGLSDAIYKRSILGTSRDLFFFGIIFIMSIYHLGLYFLRRKNNKATLFFGIFSMLFGIRILIVGERFLPGQVNLPFMIYAKFAYISAFLGFLSLLGFLYYAIPNLLSKKAYKWNNRVMTIASVFILILPMSFSDYILMPISVWGICLLVYAVIKMVQAIYQQKAYAISVFIGLLFLALAMVNDLIYQYTMLSFPSMIPLGLSLFCFVESHTMAMRYIESNVRSERLDQENKQFLSEIIMMNSRLEENVESRTKALKSALLEVEKLSITDHLTGLPNRRSMMTHLSQYIETGSHFYIAILDIDHFKVINDSFGHNVGDRVLMDLANLMNNYLEKKGIVGRWGGEEFLIILSHKTQEEAFNCLNTLRQMIYDFRCSDLEKSVSVTIGFTVYQEGYSIDQVIATADEALYRGKNEGRNLCLFQPLKAKV